MTFSENPTYNFKMMKTIKVLILFVATTLVFSISWAAAEYQINSQGASFGMCGSRGDWHPCVNKLKRVAYAKAVKNGENQCRQIQGVLNSAKPSHCNTQCSPFAPPPKDQQRRVDCQVDCRFSCEVK